MSPTLGQIGIEKQYNPVEKDTKNALHFTGGLIVARTSHPNNLIKGTQFGHKAAHVRGDFCSGLPHMESLYLLEILMALSYPPH